jgi:hypothetical protein
MGIVLFVFYRMTTIELMFMRIIIDGQCKQQELTDASLSFPLVTWQLLNP